ncbi:TonB family protein [Lutimaribacter saemankumensis]|uniref:Protein TonB n=1 Tax=Lutimaribacter saemankumensis TaxID=490829 RepID=A0A1G8M3N9_9RHOB|nr:TonB family protein [Lutimaribacter saemankumensis]SDI62531.1 protein TonB [Lutimaribacter saemankumensis]
MKILFEYAAFLTLSVGAHVLVLAQPGGVGGGPGGEGGEAQITLAAMSGNMADMVAAWTAAPEVQAVPVAMAPPPVSDVVKLPQVVEMKTLPQSVPAGLPMPQTPQAAPRADTAPPPRPVRPEPEKTVSEQSDRPDVRPVARPVEQAQPRPAQQASRAAQKAKGQGNAPQAGHVTVNVVKTPAPSAAQTRSLMADWGGRVRASVEKNKRFPRGTRASGKVNLRLTLSHTGQLQGVVITRSSGNEALDRAAVAAVQRARFPAAPKGLAAGSHRFNLPVSFSR